MTNKVKVLAAAAALVFSGGAAYAQSPVTVTNATSAPVPTKDQNNGAYHPVTLYTTFSSSGTGIGTGLKDVNTQTVFYVPTGKRLVVESINGYAYAVSGPKVRFWVQRSGASPTQPQLLFYTPTTGGFVGFYNGQSHDAWETMTQMRWYVDEGNYIYAGWDRIGGNSTVSGELILTGYLVDLPPPGVAGQ